MWNPKVPGSAVAPTAVGCAPRPTMSEKTTGLRPQLYQINPRGRVLVRPRASALPGTIAREPTGVRN